MDKFIEPERGNELPRLVFIEQLSDALKKKLTTIRTYATNAKYKHLIPTPYKLPGSRRLCWLEEDVTAWMLRNRPANPPPIKRPRGRPTKAEQMERQRWAVNQSNGGYHE